MFFKYLKSITAISSQKLKKIKNGLCEKLEKPVKMFK